MDSLREKHRTSSSDPNSTPSLAVSLSSCGTILPPCNLLLPATLPCWELDSIGKAQVRTKKDGGGPSEQSESATVNRIMRQRTLRAAAVDSGVGSGSSGSGDGGGSVAEGRRE